MRFDLRGYLTCTSAISSVNLYSSSSATSYTTSSSITPAFTSAPCSSSSSAFSTPTSSSTPCPSSTTSIVTHTSTATSSSSSYISSSSVISSVSSSISRSTSSSGSSSSPIAPSSSLPNSTSTTTNHSALSSSVTTEMPSTFPSTIASTLTVFVTLTSGLPQSPSVPVIPSAIEGLSDCSQGVLFPLLSESQCNPGNFPCLCNEFDRLNAQDAIAGECPADAVSQFEKFRSRTCGNPGRLVSVSSASSSEVISTTISSTKVNVTSSATITNPIVTGVTMTNISLTGISKVSTTSGLFTKKTGTHSPIQPTDTPVQPTETAVQPSFTTNEVVIPTVGPNKEPTTVTSQVVSLMSPTGPGGNPLGPEFTGAAGTVETPEFGSGRMGLVAGAMGLMGLVFADL